VITNVSETKRFLKLVIQNLIELELQCLCEKIASGFRATRHDAIVPSTIEIKVFDHQVATHRSESDIWGIDRQSWTEDVKGTDWTYRNF
jgi:hypothetical protein